MKTDWTHLERFRFTKGTGHHARFNSPPGIHGGMFYIPIPGSNRTLRIIASSAEFEEAQGWEHVSVCAIEKYRGRENDVMPTWDDMCAVKGLFWQPDECVVQFHPPQSEYVNRHAMCLHLWKHVDGHQTPPKILIG